jgi:HAD superfamily hydrolase (TIGR01509 family)
MIKVIAVDLGGVLFADGSTTFDTLEKKYGYDPEIIKSLITGKASLKHEYLCGHITDEQFWNSVQVKLPDGYDAQKIRQEYYDSYVLDDDVLRLLTDLRARHTIVAFSGNLPGRIEWLENKYQFRQLFHKEVYSFDYGCTKPDKEFIDCLVLETGVQPTEIVYIDDRADLAAPAAEQGINVVIYERGKIESLAAQFAELGII